MLDIVNLLYILTIMLVFYKYYHIKNIYIILLLLHLIIIFVTNGILFNPSYMPDQFKYLEVAQHIRSFDFFNESNFMNGIPVYLTGIFFGFFPIPFIESVYSISMINYLLYLYVFLFMYKKGFLKSKFIAFFYLLFPSLVLYSSVALRDMLIFVVMFFGIYFMLIKKQHLISFLILSFLIFIKFQNFLILIVAIIISISFTSKIRLKHILFSLTLFFLMYVFFGEYFSIEMLNHYRQAFYNENISTIQDLFVSLSSYYDLFIYSPPSALNFMFRPLPWKEFGAFQFIQFIENLVVSVIIIKIMYQNKKYKLWKLQEVKFLNILLFLALIIYGLVVYNSGTAVRYKFPFITIYTIFSWYYIYRAKQICQKSSKCAE